MEEGFELDVFARGTSIADYDRTEDGWSKKEAEFVDMLNFQLTNKKLGAVICQWSVPGDLEQPEQIQVHGTCRPCLFAASPLLSFPAPFL